MCRALRVNSSAAKASEDPPPESDNPANPRRQWTLIIPMTQPSTAGNPSFSSESMARRYSVSETSLNPPVSPPSRSASPTSNSACSTTDDVTRPQTFPAMDRASRAFCNTARAWPKAQKGHGDRYIPDQALRNLRYGAPNVAFAEEEGNLLAAVAAMVALRPAATRASTDASEDSSPLSPSFVAESSTSILHLDAASAHWNSNCSDFSAIERPSLDDSTDVSFFLASDARSSFVRRSFWQAARHSWAIDRRRDILLKS
mmetsp:Transcript_30517/g.64835  ORF Transcript_30517/g.64835 Transcript_30517/m.64835 type:complete len:258 (-) Transcript_30517:2509-3282(-)